MKKLKYNFEQIEIILYVPDEDYDWIRLLFARNNKPFEALLNIGYDVVDKKESNGY